MASSQWVVSPICYSTALVVVGVRVRIPVRLNFPKLSFRNYISCVLKVSVNENFSTLLDFVFFGFLA